MSDPIMRGMIAILIIGSFTLIVLTVLFGFVRVEQPEIAKLVGALFGYFTGLISPIIARYFKEGTP